MIYEKCEASLAWRILIVQCVNTKDDVIILKEEEEAGKKDKKHHDDINEKKWALFDLITILKDKWINSDRYLEFWR